MFESYTTFWSGKPFGVSELFLGVSIKRVFPLDERRGILKRRYRPKQPTRSPNIQMSLQEISNNGTRTPQGISVARRDGHHPAASRIGDGLLQDILQLTGEKIKDFALHLQIIGERRLLFRDGGGWWFTHRIRTRVWDDNGTIHDGLVSANDPIPRECTCCRTCLRPGLRKQFHLWDWKLAVLYGEFVLSIAKSDVSPDPFSEAFSKKTSAHITQVKGMYDERIYGSIYFGAPAQQRDEVRSRNHPILTSLFHRRTRNGYRYFMVLSTNNSCEEKTVIQQSEYKKIPNGHLHSTHNPNIHDVRNKNKYTKEAVPIALCVCKVGPRIFHNRDKSFIGIEPRIDKKIEGANRIYI